MALDYRWKVSLYYPATILKSWGWELTGDVVSLETTTTISGPGGYVRQGRRTECRYKVTAPWNMRGHNTPLARSCLVPRQIEETYCKTSVVSARSILLIKVPDTHGLLSLSIILNSRSFAGS